MAAQLSTACKHQWSHLMAEITPEERVCSCSWDAHPLCSISGALVKQVSKNLLLLLMSLSTAILLVHTDYALETYSACGLLGRVSQS